MITKNKRIISFILTVVMVLSLVPTISLSPMGDSIIESNIVEAATTTGQSTVHVYKDDGSLTAKGLEKVVDGVVARYVIGLWHYSGGYWGGNGPKVYDSQFKQSQGGVANVEDTFSGLVYGNNQFIYNIANGTSLAEALDRGEDLYVEIDEASDNPDVTFDNLFDFPVAGKKENGDSLYVTNPNGSLKGKDDSGNLLDTVAKVEKVNGQWRIVFNMPLKLNYYKEKEFNFSHFNLRLQKYIPIPKLGYGYIMFSMFPRYKGGIQNNGNLPSYMWFADELGTNYKAWETNIDSVPENKIHPKMIYPTGTPSGHSGYLKDGYTIKLLRNNGILVNSGEYKIGIDTLAYAGAVGMYYRYDLKLNIYSKPKTKIVASYVEITGVDNNNMPTYRTVAESTLLDEKYVSFTDEVANIEPHIVLQNEEGTYVGVVNDVVSSFKNLGEPKTVVWENNVVPSGSEGDLDVNAKYIDYYRFEMISPVIYALMDIIGKVQAGQEVTDADLERMIDAYCEISGQEITDKAARENLKDVFSGIRYNSYDSVTGWCDYLIGLANASEYQSFRASSQKAAVAIGIKADQSHYHAPAETIEGWFNPYIVPDLIEKDSEVELTFSAVEMKDPLCVPLMGRPVDVEIKGDVDKSTVLKNLLTLWSNEGVGTTTEDDLFDKMPSMSEITGSVQGNTVTGNTHHIQPGVAGSTSNLDKITEKDSKDNIVEGEATGVGTDQNMYIKGSGEDLTEDSKTVQNKKGTVSVNAEIETSVDSNYFDLSDGLYSSEGYVTNISLTTEDIIYVRYVVYPAIIQRNRIHVIEDGRETSIYVIDDVVLDIANDYGGEADVYFQDLTAELQSKGPNVEVELNRWVVSPENIENLVTTPIPATGDPSGTTIPGLIEKVGKSEDVYADWNLIIKNPADVPAASSNNVVPQWRLSKYQAEYPTWLTALMSLSLVGDEGCYASASTLTPNAYRYWVLNPNENRAEESTTPADMKFKPWVHSKALTRGSYSVTHNFPMAAVDVNGTLNLIKDTASSKLLLAKWKDINGEPNLMKQYDIDMAYTPQSGATNEYVKSDILDYGLENKNKFTHKYGIEGGCCDGCSSNSEKHRCRCGCRLGTEYPSPSYTDAEYAVNATFKRYIQSDKSKLTVSSDFKNDNGFTTMKYQLNETLNIYPEYGMIFDDDFGGTTVKWLIGDKARQINPVVYQTLEHKVYVYPNSTGSSVATDTRALTQAKTIGEGNKQVIYKGAAVNTAFQIYKSDKKDGVGLMTVKTYALDFKSGSHYSQFNGSGSAWGNNYNSYDEHSALLTNIGNSNKAAITSKLLVDSPSFNSLDYTGADKRSTSNPYKIVKYSGSSNNMTVVDSGNAVMFEHELIIRSGHLIGVKYNDRKGNISTVAITQLKAKDEALYNAILNMSLYNEDNDKSKTLFTSFDYKNGDVLSEEKYATELASARRTMDGIATPDYAAIKNGDKWYSEDTTILVIREYVSNYEVPSTSVSDKLAMTVNGLNTPANKTQFFSVMGKGHIYLKYNLDITPPSTSDIGSGKVQAYFEYSSFGGDNLQFGEQATNYLVPNVSITDTTRLN